MPARGPTAATFAAWGRGAQQRGQTEAVEPRKQQLPTGAEKWLNEQCAAWALAHQQLNPELRLGLSYEQLSEAECRSEAAEDGEEWDGEPRYRAQHVFTHDDNFAYDAAGIHPMPYEEWDATYFDLDESDVEDTGLLEAGYVEDAEQWIRQYGDPRI